MKLIVHKSWMKPFKSLSIKISTIDHGLLEHTEYDLNNIEAIKASQKLIKAAMELLLDECKDEIELLQAVHRKLDSKGEL